MAYLEGVRGERAGLKGVRWRRWRMRNMVGGCVGGGDVGLSRENLVWSLSLGALHRGFRFGIGGLA